MHADEGGAEVLRPHLRQPFTLETAMFVNATVLPLCDLCLLSSSPYTPMSGHLCTFRSVCRRSFGFALAQRCPWALWCYRSSQNTRWRPRPCVPLLSKLSVFLDTTPFSRQVLSWNLHTNQMQYVHAHLRFVKRDRDYRVLRQCDVLSGDLFVPHCNDQRAALPCPWVSHG